MNEKLFYDDSWYKTTLTDAGLQKMVRSIEGSHGPPISLYPGNKEPLYVDDRNPCVLHDPHQDQSTQRSRILHLCSELTYFLPQKYYTGERE